MLSLVLDNLIDNAAKYTPSERDPIVTVDRDPARPDVYFVRDNGIGFDPSFAERIFLPFERLHRDEEYPGTGIGLANVRRIVERHGGEVWAESQPGDGTTIFFRLPADS